MQELNNLTTLLGGFLSYDFKDGKHKYKVKFQEGSFEAESNSEAFAIDALKMYLKTKFPKEYKYATKTNAS